MFSTSRFRVYTNTDVVGCEYGAALKNVIAIAAGICDGLGYGDNTKGALLTRGLAEISRLGAALGGKRETFSGLTGMGDLITTAISRRRAAEVLAGPSACRLTSTGWASSIWPAARSAMSR